MYLSKRSNGVYYLWYHNELGCKRKVSTQKKLKADALGFVKNFRQTEREHKARLQNITLQTFQTDFLTYSSGVHTEKTQRHFKVAFKEFCRVIGDLPLQRIGIREIEQFLSVKKAEASDWTARKYYTALASAFEKAIDWNFLSVNPFRKVPKPKGKETYPLFFSRTEFEHLLSFIIDKDFRELCITALFTGVRLGELLSLEWSDIDFPQRMATIQNKDTFQTKSKRNRVLPLNDTLFAVLIKRRTDALNETGYVFHRRGMKLKEDFVSKTFKGYVKLSGLNPTLHFHSLRHSFASWLVQDGVSIYAVKELLGHSDVKTTQVYSHLQPEQLHSTVNRISIVLN